MESLFLFFHLSRFLTGLSLWLSGKESIFDAGDAGELWFDPWVGKMPWRRVWQPTPVFLPGKSHGQDPWQSTGSQRVGHDWSDLAAAAAAADSYSTFGGNNFRLSIFSVPWPNLGSLQGCLGLVWVASLWCADILKVSPLFICSPHHFP